MYKLLPIIILSVSYLCAYTPRDLFIAIIDNNIAQVQAVLAAEPTFVNNQNNAGQTPLHWAAFWCNKDIVRLLLKQPSTNLDLKDNNNKTAFDCAQQKEQENRFKDPAKARNYKEIKATLENKGKLPQWVTLSKKPFSDIRFEEQD